MSALQVPPGVALAIERQDRIEAEWERRDRIDRAIERQDRQDQLARDEARFVAWHGYSSAELAAHYASQPESSRDKGGEYGSESRPAVLVDGQPLEARESADRSQQSTEASQLDARLERYRALSRDPYMIAQRAGWHQREIQRGR
jgi:hypothetical protein